MRLGFRLVERFDSSGGQAWVDYIEWSALPHLREVVGLDLVLCPSAIALDELTDEDDGHLILREYVSVVFDDLDYVLRRISDRENRDRLQLLALAREPTDAEIDACALPGFVFKGCDLIEEWSGISALTNSGGFAGAFSAADVSSCGLIATLKRAYQIQTALSVLYPDDNHADCAVWAIWRMEHPLTGR